MTLENKYTSDFYSQLRTDETQRAAARVCHANRRPPRVLSKGHLCRRRGTRSQSSSESHLDPEVHLPGGIVLHSCLQHPLWFHPLDILHVPLTQKSCSCGCKERKKWSKGLGFVIRETWIFAENLKASLGVTRLLYLKSCQLGSSCTKLGDYVHPGILHIHISLGWASSVFTIWEGSLSTKGKALLIKGDSKAETINGVRLQFLTRWRWSQCLVDLNGPIVHR